MAKFTARIGLKFGLPRNVPYKFATYKRLNDEMKILGFARPKLPTGEYINANGPDISVQRMAGLIKKAVDAIHKPNEGVVEKGEIAEW